MDLQHDDETYKTWNERKNVSKERHAEYMRRYRAKKPEAAIKSQKECAKRYIQTEHGREMIKLHSSNYYQRKKEYMLWLRDFELI